jgi:hypothetical protein
MPFFSWLISKIMQFFLGSAHQRRAGVSAKEKEAGTFETDTSRGARNFEQDYNAAAKLLRARMDERYPNGHYARLRSNENSPYDHGEDRALAVDTMSTAIAMALRKGATVQQAAEAGAASVGI